MNMVLTIMRFFVPTFIKSRGLDELFRLTAHGFQTELPEIRGLSYQKKLMSYALFTKKQAEIQLSGGYSLEGLKQRLYDNSQEFGRQMRKRLRIRNREEAAAALQILYKTIGIEFHADNNGRFEIKQCFFSSYYSSEVCTLISSLDEGLAAGIFGGGILCFDQRITEGCDRCRGSITERIIQ